MRKLTSRKFWVCVAAFLGSIATGIAGYNIGDPAIIKIGIVCAIISAAIYTTCEAATDIGCGHEFVGELVDEDDMEEEDE